MTMCYPKQGIDRCIQRVEQQDAARHLKLAGASRSATCLLMLVLSVCILGLFGCSPSSGEPQQGLAGWQEQLAKAQEEAAKIDKNAVVHWIRVEFSRSQLVQEEPADADFIFISPDGQRFRIVVRDSAPAHVVSIDRKFAVWTPAPSTDELQKYQTLASTITLGPREIAKRTLDESNGYTSGPIVGMFLEKDHRGEVGSPNIWGVRYSSEDGRTLTLFMSPQTGEQLKRET